MLLRSARCCATALGSSAAAPAPTTMPGTTTARSSCLMLPIPLRRPETSYRAALYGGARCPSGQSDRGCRTIRKLMKVSASLGHRTLGGLMIVAALAYLLHFVPRGWVPHDEGMLGQSADLVLH